MKEKTLYVSDMDGTLLDANSQLSTVTIATLNRLLQAGCLFTVATARTPATVDPLLHELHSTLPYIVLNGAAMWDNSRGDYTAVSTLSPATERAIVGAYRQQGIEPLVYRRHGSMIHVHHSGELSPQEQQFVAERTGLPHKKFVLKRPQGEYRPGSADANADPAMLIFSMRQYHELLPVQQSLLGGGLLCTPVLYHDIFDHNAGILEVYAPGVSKAHAITQLASQLGVRRIVAFGDNMNDIPMLQIATLAVAVQNAFPQVKQVAHTVIGPNTAHSVAQFIEQDMRE